MIRYLVIPLFMLILVIAQMTILELFSFGQIGIDLSLIVVVYLGFRLDTVRGGLLSLLLGFFIDCLNSAIFGLYMFLYVLIFFLSNIAGGHIYAGRSLIVASFTALCTLLEGIIIVIFYRLFFGADIIATIPNIFVPQAVIAGGLSPLLFMLFKRFEVFIHVEDRRPAKRL